MTATVFLLTTIGLLCACGRPDSNAELPAHADSPSSVVTADHVQPVPPPGCPDDSLRPPDSLTFQLAWASRTHPSVEPDHFCFALSDGVYEIASNGVGRRAGALSPRPFRLDWQDASMTSIERLLVRPYEGDVLLVLEISDGESGAAELVRLERSDPVNMPN